MKIYKNFVLCFLLLLSCGFVFAKENYFEFVLKDNVLNLQNEVEVSLKYNLVDLEESEFRTRPVSNLHFAQIWDETSEKWVSESSVWSFLPNLSKNVKIRFLSDAFLSIEVYFQIQNVKTAEIYETPTHKIWSRKWFPDYVRRLNENIMKLLE